MLASRFSKRSFCNRRVYLSHVRSGYRTGGDPRAYTVTFNRLYSKVVHVNRHGVAAVSIIANPDVYHHPAVYGPERDFSPHFRRRVAVDAGLFAIDLNGYCPRSAKASLPRTGPLRCLIKTALLVAPLYVFVAARALWMRVAQYGWTVDRLQGALAVLVLLVWSLGYFVSIVWRKGQNPLFFRAK